VLLPAFAEVRARKPRAALAMYGPGTEELSGGGVRGFGELHRPQALALLATCDVFVRPTIADGDSVSVREALALGRAVVATALGHRRLAIIDLSQAGAQPMQNEDGTVTVTFNGEIYNYLGLREELIARGHVFRSRCDTEVLVHGYEEWGDALPERLGGMFAFAIWDARRQRLFLARDRLGKKPVYYHLGRDRLLFGSEIKSLLCDAAVPRQLDDEALDLYLSARYVPAPLTMFSGIQ